ncbi:MAG TPA: hypothetical protein VKX28_08000 [Xanthobacteraceae bacterium]|jgi:hypothetical protein|nr:hypothetical protein [Xanthobacteraceae bacterium]
MKRSAHVALVVMSAATVGGIGYAMMPSQNCAQPDGVTTNAAQPSCRSSSSGFFHGRSIFGWGSSNSSSGVTSSNSTAAPSRTSAGTERGGFGGFFAGLSRGS